MESPVKLFEHLGVQGCGDHHRLTNTDSPVYLHTHTHSYLPICIYNFKALHTTILDILKYINI